MCRKSLLVPTAVQNTWAQHTGDGKLTLKESDLSLLRWVGWVQAGKNSDLSSRFSNPEAQGREFDSRHARKPGPIRSQDPTCVPVFKLLLCSWWPLPAGTGSWRWEGL